MKSKRRTAQATGVQVGVQPNQQGYLRSITLYILIGIVALAPFFGGLHHTVSRLVFSALTLAVCGVWIMGYAKGHHQHEFRLGWPDIAAAAVLLLYFTGIFRAASVNGAINMFLTWGSVFAMFWAWSTLRPTPPEKALLYRAVVGSAFSMGLWGLLAYVGVVPAGNVLAFGRISAGFYYANATASMLMIGLLLTLILGFSKDESAFWSRVYVGCAVMLIPAFLLTLSRGAWLVLLVMIPILIYSQRHALIRFIAYLTVIGLAGLLATFLTAVVPNWMGLMGVFALTALVAMLMDRYLGANSRITVLALGAVLVGLLGYVGYAILGPNTYALRLDGSGSQKITFEINDVLKGDYNLNADLTVDGSEAAATLNLWTVVEGSEDVRLLTQSYPSGKHAISHAIALPQDVQALRLELILSGAGAKATLAEPQIEGSYSASFESLPHRLLPYSLASRAAKMSGDSLLNDTRFVFYRDGAKLFKQAPLLGRGGGAWRAMYGTVQSYFYGATHIHSDPYDVLLGVGLMGLILYLAFWLGALWDALRSSSSLQRGVAVVALAVLAHSLGDALLSFPALYVVCFALLGSIRVNNAVSEGRRSRINSPVVYRVMGVVMLLCTVITASMFLAELDYTEYKRQSNANVNLTALRRAATLNPWNADYLADLGTVLSTSRQTEQEGLRLLQRASRLEPCRAVYVGKIGTWYKSRGDYLKTLEYYQQALSLQPMNIQQYEYLTFAASEAALQAEISTGDRELFADQVLKTVDTYHAILEKSDPQYLKRSGIPFTLSTSFDLAVGTAYTHKGQYAEAEKYVRLAYNGKGPEEVKSMANLWLHRLKELAPQVGTVPGNLAELVEPEAHQVYWNKIVAATAR